MLGKLIKYEFKSTSRIFLPIYAAILVLSILTSLKTTNPGSEDLLSVLFPTILALTFTGLLIMTLIMVVKRFDTNLLSDEGYLMFTLPVKITDLINSKLALSIFWAAASTFLFILSMAIIFFRDIKFSRMFYEISKAFSQFPNAGILTVLTIVIMLLVYINLLLKIYTSLSIAQAFSITGNRIFGGVLVFIGIEIGLNIIQTIIMFIVSTSSLLENYFKKLSIIMSSPNWEYLYPHYPVILLIIITVILLIVNAAFYYATHYFLKNKLNLE
jgi:hypothetical protein